MSNASPSDHLSISPEEIDHLTAGLSADELAELGLGPEPSATLSQEELDQLLGAAGGDLGLGGPTLPRGEFDRVPGGRATQEEMTGPPTPPRAPIPPAPARPRAMAPGAAAAVAEVRPVQFAPLADANAAPTRQNIGLLMDVELKLTAELGQARLTIREILDLGAGSIVELNRLAGEPVDITVNNTLIAKGEVVVVDEKFGIRVLDVVSPAKRIASFM
jgi:flagellar motor switch protein FliN